MRRSRLHRAVSDGPEDVPIAAQVLTLIEPISTIPVPRATLPILIIGPFIPVFWLDIPVSAFPVPVLRKAIGLSRG
jgi:hypothetical protein